MPTIANLFQKLYANFTHETHPLIHPFNFFCPQNKRNPNATPCQFYNEPIAIPKPQTPFALPKIPIAKSPPELKIHPDAIAQRFVCVPRSTNWKSNSHKPDQIVPTVWGTAWSRRRARFLFYSERRSRGRSRVRREPLPGQNQLPEPVGSPVSPPPSPEFPNPCRDRAAIFLLPA